MIRLRSNQDNWNTSNLDNIAIKMISPPRIRTNEDSSKDILPKHILAVSQKLGPNIDTQLAKTSLSASISKNVTHACNLYLRKLLEDNPDPESARQNLQQLFYTNTNTNTNTTTTPTLTESIHSTKTPLLTIPEAILQNIGFYLNLYEVFNLRTISKISQSTFASHHSFWKSYCNLLYPLKRNENADASEGKYPTKSPSKQSNFYQVIIRSKLCEYYGSCPRCSAEALKSDTFQECKMALHQTKYQLQPSIFGFPSNLLIRLSRVDNLIHLGEDHDIEKSPLWVCKECNAGYGSWPYTYPLACT